MHENDRHPGRLACPRHHPAKNSLPAARLRRAGTVLGAIASAALLGACTSPLLLSSGADGDDASRRAAAAAREERAYADSTRAARAAVAIDRHERMRSMTASQIATEWGTWQLGRGPSRQKRNVVALPSVDYSLSIREIMANAGCRSCEQKPYHQMVMLAANLHGVPASLIHAVIQKESAYNPAATSRQHARGLMQITPGTGKYMGIENSRELYDPQTNINTGTAYLKYLMRNHDTVDKVLAAYNSGPGNVRKYNGVPPFSETRRYVRDVKSLYAITSSVQ